MFARRRTRTLLVCDADRVDTGYDYASPIERRAEDWRELATPDVVLSILIIRRMAGRRFTLSPVWHQEIS